MLMFAGAHSDPGYQNIVKEARQSVWGDLGRGVFNIWHQRAQLVVQEGFQRVVSP